MSDDEHVGIVLEAKDNASATIKKVRDGVASVNDAAAAATAKAAVAGPSMSQRLAKRIGSPEKNLKDAFGHAQAGVGNLTKNMVRLGAVAGTFAVGAGAQAVRWAGDFEAGMLTINTIARETPEGLKKMGDGIRSVARRTGADINDLQSAMYDLYSAGVTDAATATKVLGTAASLATGGLSTNAEAVDLLTTALNTYGGGAKEAAKYADQFAKAVEVGKVSVSDMASVYATVAPLAKQFGVTNEEIAASMGWLTGKGVRPGAVATQMGSAITSLIKPTKALKDLSKETGTNYVNMLRKHGLVSTLERVRQDADKNGLKADDMAALFGRKEALSYYLSTTGGEYKGFKGVQKEVRNSAGTADEQANERMKGFNFQLQRTKALIKDAGITIGTALLPKVSSMLEQLNTFINNNQPAIERLGNDAANGFQAILGYAKRIPWEAIGDSLRVGAMFARTIMDALMAAPAWLQTAVVTGWGLNKLTGGALTGIAGSLTKAAVSKVLQRGETPATPLYVSDVAGGATKGAAGAMSGMKTMMKGLLGTGLMAGGIGLSTGAVDLGMGDSINKSAGALSTIAGAFMLGGPVLMALTAISQAVALGVVAWQNMEAGQRDLAAKAEGTKNQGREDATSNLGNLTRYLRDIQGLDRMLLDTTASKETGQALMNLSDRVGDTAHTQEQIREAIASLEAAQEQAIGHGWADAGNHIGAKIEELKAKLGQPLELSQDTIAKINKAVKLDESTRPGGIDDPDSYLAGGANARTPRQLRQLQKDRVKKGATAAENEPAAATGNVTVKATDKAFVKNLSASMREAFSEGGAKQISTRVQGLRRDTQAVGRGITEQGSGLGDKLDQVRSEISQVGATANNWLQSIATRTQDVIVTVKPQPISLNVSGRAIASAITTETYQRSPMYQGA